MICKLIYVHLWIQVLLIKLHLTFHLGIEEQMCLLCKESHEDRVYIRCL